jgi:hypothetical protein
MGFPDARLPACVNTDALRDRDLERALTDTQLASGKSLVSCAAAVPRGWMPSACAARALDGLGVISGEISSPSR